MSNKISVGIISMQRVVNNGSFLQAYALKRMIEENCHAHVEFIDFHIDESLLNKIKTSIIGKCKYIDALLCWGRSLFSNTDFSTLYNSWKFYDLYQKECLPKLGVNKEHTYESTVDVMVFGSDEVFNITQYEERGRKIPWDLYGENCKAKRKVSYAASCGGTTLDKVLSMGFYEKSKQLLSDFDSFSVRDKNTYDFLRNMTGNEKIKYNLDPVFIYDFKNVKLTRPKHQNYILIYAYSNRINKESEIRAIKEFAQKYNKKTICVNMTQLWCDEFVLVHPFELLSYFYYADYVVTDTFHGAVLSIKYNKNMAVFVRESNKEKLGYLLEEFGLMDCHVLNADDLEEILLKKNSWNHINEIIEKERSLALEYIQSEIY